MKAPNSRSASRAAAALVIAAGIGGVTATAPAVATGTPFTYTAVNHYGHCGNELDPARTADIFTMTPDPVRRYDGINSVTIGAANGTTGSSPSVGEESFTVNLCAGIPTFPATFGGVVDNGIELRVCVDPNTLIASKPVYAYTDHYGEAHYDGPFPPGLGYRFCSFVRIEASVPGPGNVVTWGTAVFDPAQGLVDRQTQSSLHDTAGVATLAAPTANVGTPATGFSGASTLTFYLPDTVAYSVEGTTSGPIVKTLKLALTPFLVPGSTVQDWSVTTALSSYGTQGSEAPYAITDWAPGYESCTPPTCAATPGNSYDLGAQPDPWPVNPALGQWDCVLSWNYYAQESSAFWPAMWPGQGGWPATCGNGAVTTKGPPAGGNQDVGDACAAASSCANPGAATPRSDHYSSTYGRGPNTRLFPGVYHFAGYEFGTPNSFSPMA